MSVNFYQIIIGIS